MNCTTKNYNSIEDASLDIEKYLNSYDTSKGDFSIEVDIDKIENFEDCGFSKNEIIKILKANIEKLDQYKGTVCSSILEQDCKGVELLPYHFFEYSDCEEDITINSIEKFDKESFYKLKSYDGIFIIFNKLENETLDKDCDPLLFITKKFIYENLEIKEIDDIYNILPQIKISFSLT